MGLEELTDYVYDGEVKRCTEKLYKLYITQLAPSSKQAPESRVSNKENYGALEKIKNDDQYFKHQGEKKRSVSSYLKNPKANILKSEEAEHISHNTTRSEESLKEDKLPTDPQSPLIIPPR